METIHKQQSVLNLTQLFYLMNFRDGVKERRKGRGKEEEGLDGDMTYSLNAALKIYKHLRHVSVI